jgi:TRAP-type C4-dicarboxylate transport system permease small subunit
MIWLIFLGGAYACRSAQMISLTFVSERTPPYLHRYMDAMTALICIAFYALLIRVGLKSMEFGWIEKSPVLQFPKAFVYLAMPVGAAIMIINTLTHLVERGVLRKIYRRLSPARMT